MNPGLSIVEKLIAERPQLHPGQDSWAVSPRVLRYFEEVVKTTDCTAETGAGYTTVALTALGAHHVSVTSDTGSAEMTRNYIASLGIVDKLTFLVEPSELALPKLSKEKAFDFAFVDGCHAYPLPAIDWHFLDLHLRVGGLIGFDNTEIPAVHAHTEFLRVNGSYRLVKTITHERINYTIKFYEKIRDEPRVDVAQPFCHRRVTRNNFRDSLKTSIYGLLGREGKPWPWS